MNKDNSNYVRVVWLGYMSWKRGEVVYKFASPFLPITLENALCYYIQDEIFRDRN